MAHKRTDWPVIKMRRYPTGNYAWIVDCGMVEGRRPRFTYTTKAQAETKAEQLRVERENNGTAIFTLSGREHADAGRALAILAPLGASLEVAAKFYEKHAGLIKIKKTALEVTEELLAAKKQDKKSEKHLKNLRLHLKEGFAVHLDFESRPLYEITAGELEAWLRGLEVAPGLDVAPITRNTYRRSLSILFNFALNRGYIVENPVAKVEIAQVKPEKPKILTLLEARAMLQAAQADFIPAVALGLFSGLRPESEVCRLDWSAIDFKDKSIDITKSKNVASERFVKMSENLIQWLRPHAQKSGPVFGLGLDAYYYRLERSRKKAAAALRERNEPCPNLENWGQDTLRHCYGSYHYAQHKDAPGTVAQMGHTGGLRLFFRHYRNRVREQDANQYWQIKPADSLRIVAAA